MNDENKRGHSPANGPFLALSGKRLATTNARERTVRTEPAARSHAPTRTNQKHPPPKLHEKPNFTRKLGKMKTRVRHPAIARSSLGHSARGALPEHLANHPSVSSTVTCTVAHLATYTVIDSFRQSIARKGQMMAFELRGDFLAAPIKWTTRRVWQSSEYLAAGAGLLKFIRPGKKRVDRNSHA
jgi:hypothetical protein